MFKILGWLISGALLMGLGEVAVKGVLAMAGKAAHAQQSDQMSYSKWNRMLWDAKPNSSLLSPPQTKKKIQF